MNATDEPHTDEPHATADTPYISDRDEADLADAAAEAAASEAMIARHYRVRFGARLLRRDFEDCLRRVRAGEFSRKDS